jgi:DNA-binding GntR family transcriptional regulator
LLFGEAADSPRLQELLAECHRDLSEMMSTVPHSSEIRGHSTVQHAEIVRALAARDPAAVRAAMSEHIAATSSFLIGLLGDPALPSPSVALNSAGD